MTRTVQLVSILLTLSAIALWGTALRGINISLMTDLGLVSVLPPGVFAAHLLITAGFCLALSQRRLCAPLLLLHVVVLIFMLYGITALLEEAPRFATAWKLVGITEYVTRTGGVDPNLDAFHNWPGFFILSAFATETMGLASLLGLIGWAAVFFNLLYLSPLFMLFSAATEDKRLVWLGLWFFYLTNWIGQDYFSPQALHFSLYLVILWILIRWFKTPPSSLPSSLRRTQGFTAGVANRLKGWLTWLRAWLRAPDTPNVPARPGQRLGLMAIVVVLFAASVPSHQLTPLMTLASVAALVTLNRCTASGLPTLMAVLFAAWLGFVTGPFLAGHLPLLTDSLGKVGSAIDENVASRLRGSPERLFVLYIRLALTAAIWGLALLGASRRLRKSYRDINFLLLATVPFPLLVLQPYGGEMLLRIYLFTLPAMTFFAAALFYPEPSGGSWRRAVAVGLTSLVLLGSFPFARYGNERMDYFTAQEVEAVEHLYRVAAPGSLLLAHNWNLPWRYRDYERYAYIPLEDYLAFNDSDGALRLMEDEAYPNSYLILTRSQQVYYELYYGLPASSWQRLERGLLASPKLRLIFSNDDSKIFVLTGGLGSAGQ